jgi:hypothetical protein
MITTTQPAHRTGSALRTLLFGTAGALVVTAAYAAFTALTDLEVVYVSVLLGALVGWSVRLANSSLPRVLASTLSVLLTLCALLVSDYLMGRQAIGATGGPLLPSAGSFSLVERDQLSGDPVTLLFWGVSLFTAALAARPIRPSPANREAHVLPPEHHEARDVGPVRDEVDVDTTVQDRSPVQDGPTGPPDQDGQTPPQQDDTWPRLLAWRHWTAVFGAAFVVGAAGVVVIASVPLPVRDGARPSLQVGHCYNESRDSTDGSPQEVPCADPHDEEVYDVFDLTESSYPGDPAIEEESDPQCGAALLIYTGDDASQYDFSYYTPDEFSWGLGDRVVACALGRAQGSDLQTSGSEKLRGTARSTP